MATDEERGEAKKILDQAIKAYFVVSDPDSYIEAWVVTAHKLTADDAIVSQLTPDDQSFVTTRGLLDIALTQEREGQRDYDEDD